MTIRTTSIFIIFILIIANSVALGALITSNTMTYFICSVMVTVYIAIGYSYISRISKVNGDKDHDMLLKVFVGGLMLRVLLAIFLHNVYPPYGQLFKDDYGYMQKGVVIAQNMKQGILPKYNSALDYATYNAIHFFFLGDNVLYSKITNCFLGALVAIISYQIAMSMFDYKVVRLSTFLIAFNPNLIFWSATNLKEAVMLFLTLSSILVYLKLRARFTMRNIILQIILFLALQIIRFYVAYLLALVFILDMLVNIKLSTVKTQIPVILTLILLLAVTVGLSTIIDSTAFETMLSYGGATPDTINAALYSSNPREFAKYVPITGFRFLMTPLPWRAQGSFRYLVPGMVIWYFLFPFFCYGIWWAIKYRIKPAFVLYSFVIAYTLIYSFLLEVSDSRHRDQLMPIAMIMAAIELPNHKKVMPIAMLFWIMSFSVFFIYEFGIQAGIRILPPPIIITSILVFIKLKR